ncbi:MAG: hypothetical protein IAA25_03350 [Candidatus Ruminococcus intestinipullorum]|nr:hypothetical protein [Candidatus Ruminococcus intestinipullorum]
MYILKNAIRSVFRSKGRNFLMGLIVFLIALSACISLSIREASDTAKEEAMEDLKITAQISFNRESMMKEKGEREERKAGLEEIQELSLEDLETYAQCESVSDFYYTRSASFNGDSIEPVDMTGSTQEVHRKNKFNKNNNHSLENLVEWKKHQICQRAEWVYRENLQL